MKKLIVLFILLLVGCSQNKEVKLDIKILDQKQEYSNHLYRVPNEAIEEVGMQTLKRFNNYLLSFYYDYDTELDQSLYKLRLISVENGNVVKERTFDSLDYPVIYENDSFISIKDLTTGYYLILDEDLEVVHENTYNSIDTYMNQDASVLYHLTGDAGVLVENRETKENKTILDQYLYINVLNVSDHNLVISYFNKETLMDEYGLFDMEKQTMTTYDSPYALEFLDYKNNTYISNVVVKENAYQINNQYFFLDNNPILKMVDSNHFMAQYTNNNQLVIDLYDFTGNHILNTSIDHVITAFESEFIYFEEVNGYFFTVCDGTSHDYLYFLEVSDVSEEQLEFVDLIDLKGEKLSHSLYEQAIDMSEEYGVNIFVGDTVSSYFDIYDVTQSFDEKLLKQGLETLNEELKKYPESFLSQLRYSNYYQLDIHLVDSIEYSNPADEFDLGNVIGFSQASNGRYNIVLEINEETLATTFHHELSHFIDDKIMFASRYNKDLENYEQGFNQLNPKNFEYPNRYNDLPSYIYNEEYRDYFIDYYSMTYQKEDKARLFENIMSGNKELYDNQYLKAKLDYYGQYIRKVYDLPDNKVFWEEL